MAEDKNIPKSRKIVDVAEPGKSAPSASAKPIIVANRPVLKQDPMVVAGEPTDMPAQETQETVSRVAKPIRIEPIEHTEAPDTPSTAPATDLPPDLAAASVPADPSVGESITVTRKPPAGNTVPATVKPVIPPAPEKESPKEVTGKPAVSEGADVGNVTEPAEAAPAEVPEIADAGDITPPEESGERTDAPPGSSSNENDQATASGDGQLPASQAIDEAKKKEDERKAAVAAEQEKVIASRQYYLPIRADEGRRSRRLAAILLVSLIILGAVWLDLVLDAGIVKLGSIHALTNFFG